MEESSETIETISPTVLEYLLNIRLGIQQIDPRSDAIEESIKALDNAILRAVNQI